MSPSRNVPGKIPDKTRPPAGPFARGVNPDRRRAESTDATLSTEATVRRPGEDFVWA